MTTIESLFLKKFLYTFTNQKPQAMKKIGYVPYDENEPKGEGKRLGFVHYDEKSEISEVSVKKSNETAKEIGMPVSNAQMVIKGEINYFASLIISKEFSGLPKEEKIGIINQFSSYIAVDTEITVKNTLLMMDSETSVCNAKELISGVEAAIEQMTK